MCHNPDNMPILTCAIQFIGGMLLHCPLNEQIRIQQLMIQQLIWSDSETNVVGFRN